MIRIDEIAITPIMARNLILFNQIKKNKII